MHKVCTGPYPSCIVVPSINNNAVAFTASQPGRSLLAFLASLASLRGAIPRHRGGRIHRLSRCHNHARQASWHGPPPLRPPVVQLYWRNGRHICGRHRGWHVHVMGQIAFALNIKAEAQKSAQKSARFEDCGTLLSEREGAQQYRSTDLSVYGIGRSFETFGWVPPVTVGWGETSGCETLWGCSMVARGKNIVDGSKNPQFLLVMYACCVRAVHYPPPPKGYSALLVMVQCLPRRCSPIYEMVLRGTPPTHPI